MAISTQLFELIKSLTSSEKRYFRISCNLQSGEKNYLNLFEYLDQQEVYDEQVIKQKFKTEVFTKSLHVTKNYLYQLILKSLRAFHAQNYVEQRIGDHITNMLILEGRGLYHQARQALSKAQKMAKKYHQNHYLSYLLKKEASYHFAIEKKRMKENIEKINKELMVINDTINDENKIYCLYHHAVFIARGRSSTATDIENLKSNVTSYHKQLNKKTKRSFYSICHEAYIQSNIAYAEGDTHNRYINKEKIINLWRTNPYMIEAESHIYKVHLANFLNAAFQYNKYDNFMSIIDELDSAPTKNFNEAAETFQNVTFYRLLYYLNTRRLETAKESLATITNGMNKYEAKINKSRELAFYYNISILHFMLDYPDRALLWLNKILNQTKTDHRKDIQRFAEMLQLFYHYNLNNYDLLSSLIVSVRKKIRRWNKLTIFEQSIINGISSLLNALSKSEKQKQLIEFKNAILALKNGKSPEYIPIGYDEILLWIDKELEEIK